MEHLGSPTKAGTASTTGRHLSGRSRLPDRRPSHLETLEIGGQTIAACIGFDPATDQPREVFLNGGKEGSQFDAMLADAATIISVSLQYGVPIAALARSVGRLPNAPTTPTPATTTTPTISRLP